MRGVAGLGLGRACTAIRRMPHPGPLEHLVLVTVDRIVDRPQPPLHFIGIHSGTQKIPEWVEFDEGGGNWRR